MVDSLTLQKSALNDATTSGCTAPWSGKLDSSWQSGSSREIVGVADTVEEVDECDMDDEVPLDVLESELEVEEPEVGDAVLLRLELLSCGVVPLVLEESSVELVEVMVLDTREAPSVFDSVELAETRLLWLEVSALEVIDALSVVDDVELEDSGSTVALSSSV